MQRKAKKKYNRKDFSPFTSEEEAAEQEQPMTEEQKLRLLKMWEEEQKRMQGNRRLHNTDELDN
jgi:hypothetical protein